MPVDSRHPDHVRHAPDWAMVDDISDGRNLDNYLTPINPQNMDAENVLRNQQRFDRAVFYGVAGYTVRGLVGLVFQRDPTLEVPAALDYVAEDVDGAGVSLYQQAQGVVRELVRKGRCGLLVNFLSPALQDRERPASVKDNSRAVIQLFQAEDIINWRMEKVGADYKLTLVVLRYQRDVYKDDYQLERRDALLELRLVNGQYILRHWEKDGGDWTKTSEVLPHDATGKPLAEIPFTFVGSETNTQSIDQAPMLDICKVNAGHWNNSADYEDSAFMVGQPQPWASGIQADDLNGVHVVGSNALICVPEGGRFDFAQVKPNTLAREAMNDKVEMMVGLGAMFIQPGSAVKTATQAEGEQRVQHSVLSLIASNCSEAYTQALQWVSQFMGADGTLEFAVSQDYVDARDAAMLQQVMGAFAARALPVDDYLRVLKRMSLVDPEKTVEQFREEVEGGPLFTDFAAP